MIPTLSSSSESRSLDIHYLRQGIIQTSNTATSTRLLEEAREHMMRHAIDLGIGSASKRLLLPTFPIIRSQCGTFSRISVLLCSRVQPGFRLQCL